MEVKPIETVYKGYRFRSRLEARWAVFFDALGIEWEYEKEGYDLGEAGWYLPDFWLPEATLEARRKIGYFVEIKGEKPNPDELRKMKALNNNPPEYAWGVTWCIGVPEVPVYEGEGSWTGNTWYVLCLLGMLLDPRVRAAVAAARSARFEHGAPRRISP
jgi:hypothetical protein